MTYPNILSLTVLISCFYFNSLQPTAHIVMKKNEDFGSFPTDFEFGTSTSAYQTEGAWDEDGKGWSMWDHLIRTQPDTIADGTNADIATNSYHLFRRDIEMLKELGVTNYRLSISWPRILPYGTPDFVNPLGVAYYNNLIDELLSNGITPFVTMYHWDLPQNLNGRGGWLTDDIIDWFGDYARILYQNFGDRVKNWLTINEPNIHCYYGYGYAMHAPLIKSPGVGYYECGRNILLAHAKAYHIYNDEFRDQNGRIGFVVSMKWGIPASKSMEDALAVQDFAAFNIDHYIHPIFSESGNYPPILIQKVNEASFRQGLNSSRLRTFSPEQVEYMKGTANFLGLNHYGSKVVYRNSSVNNMYVKPSVDDDGNFGIYADPSWPVSGMISEYAPGLYHLLIYLRDNYNMPIYITENGCSTGTGLEDDQRIQYLRNYLSAAIDALYEGVKLKGYFAWSLMDNFEWSFGYVMRFGLYEVDLKDQNRTRTPRKSALVYKEIIRSRAIDYDYNPDPYAVQDTVVWKKTKGGANSMTVLPKNVVGLAQLLIYCIYTKAS